MSVNFVRVFRSSKSLFKVSIKTVVAKSNYENNTENRDYSNLKKLPWIPSISLKIKREFKKIGKDIAFTSGKNLH